MKRIEIGNNIMFLRKQKGVTQDELARYVGVSKASVSKWETGQSYPDILLLPVLATYFNVSVDELLGYSPQMTMENIHKLYQQYAERFYKEDYKKVLDDIENTVKEYYSCFPLLFYMGVLLLNYSITAEEIQKKQMEQLVETYMLRIKEECEDWNLQKDADGILNMLYLVTGRPSEVIASLKDKVRPENSKNSVLAQAYVMEGNLEKAIETYHFSIYQHTISMIEEMAGYLEVVAGQPKVFEETVKRGLTIIDTFRLDTLHFNASMGFYYCAASGYMILQQKEACYEMLERFVSVFLSIEMPMLKGDDYFFYLNRVLSKHEIMLEAPRDVRMVLKSTVEQMERNPVFAAIGQENRFKQLLRRMKKAIWEQETRKR